MERVLIEKEVWMKMWGKDDAGYNTTDDIKRYKENKKTKKKGKAWSSYEVNETSSMFKVSGWLQEKN